MVKVSVFVEGPPVSNDTSSLESLYAVNELEFQRAFNQLLSQELDLQDVEIAVFSLGSVTKAPTYAKQIIEKEIDALILIDLDAPPEERVKRLQDNYIIEAHDRIFFMIQEMEAWILSQPSIIDNFAKINKLNRKKPDEEIAENSLLKGKNPKYISGPKKKLKTLFSQYLQEKKQRGNRINLKNRRYNERRDAPALIRLLSLSQLRQDFDEVDKLIQYLISKKAA